MKVDKLIDDKLESYTKILDNKVVDIFEKMGYLNNVLKDNL